MVGKMQVVHGGLSPSGECTTPKRGLSPSPLNLAPLARTYNIHSFIKKKKSGEQESSKTKRSYKAELKMSASDNNEELNTSRVHCLRILWKF